MNSYTEVQRHTDQVLVALGTRSACPGLPKLGEMIRTRDVRYCSRPREESPWAEEQVIAEGWNGGVHVESLVPSQRTVCRGTFRGVWVYAEGHKFADWKDD